MIISEGLALVGKVVFKTDSAGAGIITLVVIPCFPYRNMLSVDGPGTTWYSCSTDLGGD